MTDASLDNSGNLVCKHCNQEIEICTDQCGTKSCGEEWVHSKTKKHECEYIVKPSDELVMSGEVLNDFKRIVVAETLEIKPEQLFVGNVVTSLLKIKTLKQLRDMDTSEGCPKIEGLPDTIDPTKYYPYVDGILSQKWVNVGSILEYIDNLRKSNDMWRYSEDEVWSTFEELLESKNLL